MRRRLLVLMGLFFIASSAAMAVLPARWLIQLLPAEWPLAIADASGTVWSGSAVLAVGPEANRRTLPDPLQWQWSLSRGLQIQIDHPWMKGSLVLVPSISGLGISAQALTLPAEVISAFDPRLAAVGPEGLVTISWPPTHLGPRSRPAGARLMEIQWRDAASALTPIRPIGDYGLTFSQGEGKTINLALSSRKGPLLLDGIGAVSAGSSPRFEGIARADPAAAPEIRAALRDILTALGPTHNDQTMLHYR